MTMSQLDPDNNNYTRSRSVLVTDLKLATRGGVIDVWNGDAMVGLDIYEDMFQNFTTGALRMIDNAGFFEKYPICGDEVLTVTFKTSPEFPGEFFTKTFDVYKCEDFTTVLGSRTRTYSLLFASPAAQKDMLVRVRMSFKGKKESAIVQSVAQNLLGISNLEVEPTKFTRQYVAAGMRPLQVINYMGATAVRPTGYPASNYLFFERSKDFKFCSLDLLMEQKTDKVLQFHVSRQSFPASDIKVANVKEYRIINTFDNFGNSKGGLYAHKVFLQDLIKKRVQEKVYNYRAEFPGQVDTDGKGVFLREKFSTAPDQLVSMVPWQKKYDNEHSDDFSLRRKPMLQQFFGYKIECEMDGSMIFDVGDNIEFRLISNESGSQELDATLSGQYIVARIRHSISYTEHKMVMEIRKNCLKS